MSEHRDAVAELMIRYATSVDARDLDRYATCFTDDVEVTGFSGGAITGLATYVAWVGEALSKYSHTHHLIGNQVVTIDGDEAHMRSYVQAMHVLVAEPDTMIGLWAIYDDRVVRTADGWKITHHHLERLIPPRRIHAPAV
jgi:3-phenylpropionate/cinnamic acid dioxygenase small subunit